MRRLLPLFALLHLPFALAAGPQTTTLPSGVTVETYRENLKRKLNLDSGSELIRYAIHRSNEMPLP